MTDAEVLALQAQAEAELNANEEAMLVSPLVVIGLVERLVRAERKLAAVASYDELHD